MTLLADILLPIIIGSAATVSSQIEAQLIFAGDAMMHQAQLDASRQPDGTYDFDTCFSALKPEIESADYAVVNLETPLSHPPYSGYPCFNSPAQYAQSLQRAGFDLMLTANNHTLDRLDAGVSNTIAKLDSLNIDHIGTYRTPDERASRLPFIADIRGIKVSFNNYTYGTNGISERTPTTIDRIDRKLIAQDIQTARAAGAEIVIVCIHWGDEYHLLPNQQQTALAKEIFASGADMIIGCHPHVIQPMELTTDNTGKRRLLVYSLGNLISNMNTVDTRGGAMVRVTLRRDSTGSACVGDAAYRLVMVERGKPGTPFRVSDAYADSLMSPLTRQHRDAFCKNALAIFDSNNINVTPDSVKLAERWGRERRKSLTPLSPTRLTAEQILRPYVKK